ncbi:M14 family metallopeptidase [Nannocystaceae bacterium ST9]
MSADLAPYPSPERRERELVEFAGRIAGAELIDYGRSVEGRSLDALRIPSRTPGAPRVLVCANIHGPEFIGNRVCAAIVAELADESPRLEPLRRRAELWLAPCLNPDGYARTWAAGGVGALPTLRHNAHGVDLNRNWPLPAGERRLPLPGAGSPTPGDATYRGEAPLGEPETAALARLLQAQDFVASTNLHSFMGVLFPARVRDREGYAGYRELCRSFTGAQAHTRYRRVASRVFDTFTGEQEDYQHHALRCWAVCVECFPLAASFAQHLRAPSLFWRFNPHDPDRWAANDIPGIAAFLLAALDRPRPG